MLSGGLKARDGAFGGAHAVGNRLLGKSRTSPSSEHFMGESVFDLKSLIGLAKASPLGGFLKEGLVVVSYSLEFQISHFESPSIASERA